jgi:hypothetical protein
MDIVKSLQQSVRFFFFAHHNEIYKSFSSGFTFDLTIKSVLFPKENSYLYHQQRFPADSNGLSDLWQSVNLSQTVPSFCGRASCYRKQFSRFVAERRSAANQFPR